MKMADNTNTNPFSEDTDDFIEDELENAEIECSKDTDFTDLTWDGIAARLLKENFLLTALEFHTEIVESGKELPRLRDYFSNPGNFERTKDDPTSPGLPRTSSIQTFDSLDFARYSDDGGGQVDERVAVLEFELRKAQDTIKSLRASLTRETETDLGSNENLDEGIIQSGKDDQIKPLEKRAINFLVNEYLLLNNYKLTSVTFSEENEDQDFEDWDDVGLNKPRPPDLLHLYKDYGSHTSPDVDICDAACSVASFDDEEIQNLQWQWDQDRELLESRIDCLEEQLNSVREDYNLALQQLSDVKSQKFGDLNSTDSQKNRTLSLDNETLVGDESHDFVNTSSSLTTENLLKSAAHSTDSRDDSTVIVDTERANSEHNSYETGDSDFIVIEPHSSGMIPECLESPSSTSTEGSCRKLSSAFKKALLDVCFHVAKDNRLIAEMSKIVGTSKDSVVLMLGRCLPHIVPNVLLAKREELIPLILCTAMLHPDPRERDNLLNILFNLIKKPDDEQRQMILTGCIAYAEHVGQARLEEELLPQCWEQISHKYVERRLLVAEACGALASYLPPEILSSLVLSMLQQMLMDDKDEEVREAVVRSLGLLIGFITDQDKYSQAYELLRSALKDSSERVVMATQHVFLPSFTSWAFELGKLEHNLIHSVIKDLEELVKCAIATQRASNSTTIPLNEGHFLLLLSTLQELIPFLYLSVIESGPYVNKLETAMSNVQNIEASRFPKPSSPLTDLKVIMGDSHRLSALVFLFEEHISQEWFEPWETINWVVNNLIPRLLEIVMGVGFSIPKIVSSLCKCFFKISRTFGKTFAEKRIRPKFIELMVLQDDHTDDQAYASAKQTSVTTCLVPVYAAGVLSAYNTDEDRKQLTQYLQEILCTLSLYQAPLDSLKAAISELGTNSSHHELILTVLWDGVVHTSAQVRSASARLFEFMVKGVSENLVSTRVFPALVTLGNDPEITVRTSTIPALGAIIENITLREMLDRVYMQIQTFMDDPMYRDEYGVNIEILRTLARVGPNAEPRFRDEFILPRLAAMALANNHVTNETKKRDVAIQLFEAYSAMSCCFINDQLVQEAMLPGLRCLRQDMSQIAQEHEEVVNSMIRDYEAKMEISRSAERSSSISSQGAFGTPPQSEDMKVRMMNKIKDTTSKANLSNIFTRKK